MSTQQFGGWLRDAREARGLTVEVIASLTKIPPRHLEALERGEPVPLPAFYQRAEIRAVARAVGVDEQLALRRLEAELAPVPPPSVEPPLVAPPPGVASEPRRVRPEYVLVMIGIGVLVVGVAGWGSLERTAAGEGTVAGAGEGTVAGAVADEGTATGEGTVKTPEPVTARLAAPLPTEVQGTPIATGGVSDDAPMAPTGPTELIVQTQPEGAAITVDGIGWGRSPVTIRHIEPGEKRVRVTMDGYTGTQRSVTVDEGSRETIRIILSSVNAGL